MGRMLGIVRDVAIIVGVVAAIVGGGKALEEAAKVTEAVKNWRPWRDGPVEVEPTPNGRRLGGWIPPEDAARGVPAKPIQETP